MQSVISGPTHLWQRTVSSQGKQKGSEGKKYSKSSHNKVGEVEGEKDGMKVGEMVVGERVGDMVGGH